MKQTCGNIPQLPKILCVGNSPNITPSSKPIHIHHEKKETENKTKKEKQKIQREKRIQYKKD